MTKTHSPRNKAWEKDRRDRLNQTFDDLAKLLPKHDPKARLSKIEILQKAIVLIEDLDRKLKALCIEEPMMDKFNYLDGRLKVLKIRNNQLLELLQGAKIAVPSFKTLLTLEDTDDPYIERLIKEESDETENIQPNKKRKGGIKKLESERPKRKYTKRKATEKDPERDPLTPEEQKLKIPDEPVPQKPSIKQVKRTPLIRIRTTGGKKRVTVKSDIYKVIQKHVLKRSRNVQNHRKVMRRKAKQLEKAITAAATESPLPELAVSDNSKPPDIEKLDINEILPNPLSNSDLSSDLFVSLHVPHVAQNAGSLSPTEAFLMSFPVVSGSVSAGKGNEQTQSEGALRVAEPLNSIGLDNLFSPKEDFQINYRSEGKQQPQQLSCPNEAQKATAFQKEMSNNYLLENIIHGNDNQTSGMVHQKQVPETQPSYSNNLIGMPALLDSNFSVTINNKPSFNNTTPCPVETMGHPIDQAQVDLNSGKGAAPSNHQIHNQSDGIFLNRNAIADGNFSLSTDTKTTNSWSYNIKMTPEKDQLHNTNMYYGNSTSVGLEDTSNYVNSQPFTFSLSKTTDTPKRTSNSKSNVDQTPQVVSTQSGGLFGYNSTPASQPSNPMLFDSYNPSFSLVPPNSFLSPRPPPPVGVGNMPPAGSALPACHQYGSKPFSFQLTSASDTPAINTSKMNVQSNTFNNSFSIAATLDSSKGSTPKSKRQSLGDGNSTHGAGSRNQERKGSKLSSDGARQRDKQDNRKADKKKAQTEENQNKSHVNWMTDSTTNSQASEFSYPLLQNSNLSMAYLPPPPPSTTSIMGPVAAGRSCRMDLNHKSDIFFAHPPEEDNSFLWTKNSAPCQNLDLPATAKYRHDDFNVSQLLPPPPPPSFVPAPPPAPFIRQNVTHSKTPTASNQWRANTSNNSSDYQPNGNYFSVSNLVVDSNKKYQPTKAVDPPLPPLIMNSAGNNKWNRTKPSNSNNNIYSAEALIGSSSNNSYGDASGSHANSTANNKHTPSKRYPMANILNNIPENLPHFNDLHPPVEGEITDYGNYNLAGSQNQFSANAGSRIEPKLSNPQMIAQDATNSYPFYSNDFIQPLFTAPPTLHLIPDGQSSVGGSANVQSTAKMSSSNKLNEYKRKYYEEDGRNEMSNQQVDFYAPPPPPSAPQSTILPSSSTSRQHAKKFSNYDISSSTNFFPAHHHPPPPPLIINHCTDTFSNYSNNSKIPQSYVTVPPPPIDFNSSSATTGTYSTNSLTNFNLSSICPEINNPIIH